MRRLIAIVLSLLVLVVAAGCGGGGAATAKQDYGHQLAAATSSLQKAFTQLGQTAGGDTSAAGAARRLRQGATALQAAADRFAGIKPPADAAAAHRKLVDGLRRLATAFRQGAAAAQRHDAQALTKALQGIASSPGAREISQAERDLARHGVTVTTASG